MAKNQHASALGKKRWKNRPRAEMIEHMRRMSQLAAKKRTALKKQLDA